VDWPVARTATVAAVARLHALTKELVVPYPRIRSGAEPQRVIRQFLDLTVQRGIAPHEVALREFVDRVQRSLAEFETVVLPYERELPHGVVHHDAHCHNVLFDGDQLMALIDFDDAYEGCFLADLVVMAAQWGADRFTGEQLDPDRILLLVNEYEKHRPLSGSERQLFVDLLLLFLLSDSAEYVRGQLERGADGEAAVNDCVTYRRYRNACNSNWLAGLQRQLTSPMG